MNYYELVGWKNRSEGKVTKVSAERLNHMDNQILANANAIGNIEEIVGLADGTLCGTVKENKTDIETLTSNLNPDYSRYTFTQYKSGALPVITASERVDVLITVSIAYNGNSLILFPAVNGVGLTHPIGGGRSMVSTTTFANVSYSETIRLGEGDTLNFSVIGSLADTNSVSIGLLPYK